MFPSADSCYQDDYLESKVMTAPPAQLHLMVLEAAIRHARMGRLSLSENNLEQTHLQLNRSREFVSELIGGLNPEYAPEMVSSLTQLFSFAYRNLALADFERSEKRIDEALLVLEAHRETWIELIQRLVSSTAPTAAPQLESFEWEG